MTDWRDDSWKDGYDAWKLSPPPEYDEDTQEECWHEEREIDWEGYATCNRCGKGWFASAEEIACERECNAAYDAYMRREERMEKYWRPLRRFWLRLFVWAWRPKPKPIDDEIPF